MKSNNPKLYPIIGIVIGLFLIFASIPINDNIDIITDVSIEYPLIWSDPKITDVSTEITAHTAFRLPSFSTGTIISKSNVKIKVFGGGKVATESVGTLYRSEIGTYTVVLPNVPATTNTIRVELYSGNTKLDSKEVSLT